MNDAVFAEAMTLHQAGQLTAAAVLYRRILEQEPEHVESLHLLGLLTAEQTNPEAGISLIRRAMAIDPGRAVHHNSLGKAYRLLGQPLEAVREYRIASALRPDSPEIRNNFATTLLDLGLHADAVAHYRAAAERAPEVADIWYNLANVLADTGPSEEAEACYRTAIALKPKFTNALGNYGRWLMTQSRWADAEARLAEALVLSPKQAGTWNNLGLVLQETGGDEAEDCYRNAVAIEPALADAHYNLGCLLSGHGRTDEAIACHQAAIAADAGFGTAWLALCMAQLPILYRSEAEVAERRRNYVAALEELGGQSSSLMADAIGKYQPFFLPYQGQDDRALQSLYGQFACRVLAETEPVAPLANPPASHERIRVGIVSGFFCDHTLFKLFLEGWLSQIDRSRFEVIGFHTGRISDGQTARCVEWCDLFVQGLPSAGAWREAISAAAPHVLLYPEVGMDPIAGRMAAMRLAPVQCVAWGQPETTGLPTIDYFLSSALMEPTDGDAYYTERLVRLPELGLWYTPDAARADRVAPARDRVAIGLSPEVPVFWSGQALYKYLPSYDVIFPRIATELGTCQFVFIDFAKSKAVTEAFRDRLFEAFAAAGLDAARFVVFLPPMSQHGYLDAVGLADVILDTPGWSGGKSTLDCLARDPAIVTMPGRFMRGRHTAAILRRIGCTETIAELLDEYVSIAVRLARDPAWRGAVRQAVASGKSRAFGDLAYMRALETFLAEALVSQGALPLP